MPTKRGQGLSLNVVIIAVIVIVVLVVLISIFRGRTMKFGREIESCAIRGGECSKEADKTTCPAGHTRIMDTTDCRPNACCISVLE